MPFALKGERAFRNISVHGLHRTATVRSIYQGPAGYVWLGTDNRLVRFDGSNLIDYTLPVPAAAQTDVTSIGSWCKCSVLAGTASGLWQMTDVDGTPVFEQLFKTRIPSVAAITVLDSATVAVATPRGLKILAEGMDSVRTVRFAPNLFAPENDVRAMHLHGDRLFCASPAGVYAVDIKSLKVVADFSGISVPDVSSLAVSRNRIFIGSQTKGLKTFELPDGNSMRSVDVGCNVVTSLACDNAGTVYVGTDGNGIVILDAGTAAETGHLVKKNGRGGELASNQVYSLLAGKSDQLWVGYYQGAADYTLNIGNKFNILTMPGVFDTRGITIRTLEMSGDALMLGTRHGIYLLRDNGREVRHVEMPRLRSNLVLSLHKEGDVYYIGTYGGGVEVYDPEADKVTDLTDKGNPVMDTGHVFAISCDRKGTVWFGTSSGLYAYRNGALVHHYDESNSRLPDNNVYSVYFDSNGTGWIGTDKGMAVLSARNGELRTDVFPQDFMSNRSIRHIYEDSGHRLYFVADKGPLTVSNPDMTEYSDIDPGMFGNANVRSVIEDNAGAMWVVTDAGIYRWDKADRATRYGYADGIVNPAFISGNPVIDGNGRIFIGSPEGLLYFDPGKIGEPQDSQPLAPTAVYVDDALVHSTATPGRDGVYRFDAGRLPHIIRVDFSNFLFSNPDDRTYQYSLNGKDWHYMASDMKVILYDLNYGRNVLSVRNAHMPEAVTRIEINIPWPVWIWALAVAAIVMVIAVFAAVTLHRRHRRGISPDLPPAGVDTASQPEAEGQAPGTTAPEKKKYSSNRLSERDCEEIGRKLDELMATVKPYLHTDLSVGELGELAGVSSHRLSQYFSQHLNLSFYDYINRYRVDEFKELCRTGDLNRYTMTALSEKAGFSSRASFFRYFKKYEGKTPAEYIKSFK